MCLERFKWSRKPASQPAELTYIHNQTNWGRCHGPIVTNDSCWQPGGSLPPGSYSFSLRCALKRDNGPLSSRPRFSFVPSLLSYLFPSCPCHPVTLLYTLFCTSSPPSLITMSGLILNCLLPFVRPPRTVSVLEAQNMSTADYLDAASATPIPHSLIQMQRVDHQKTGLFLSPLVINTNTDNFSCA